MAKCTKCGAKAGWMMQMCDSCLQAYRLSDWRGNAASGPSPPLKPFASEVDYSQNIRELPDDTVLRAILLDKAIVGSIGSLLVWGAINLGAWYLLREDTLSTFRNINAPPGTFDAFIYGGAVIGVCMLVFGVLGAVMRSSIVGWLDGFSLLIIGGWNVAYDFLLADVIRPYGYTIKQPSTIWVYLGIGQIIWGGKQLIRFSELGTKPSGIDPTAKAQARNKLQDTLKAPASPQIGRIKLSITTTHYFPYREKTERFTMWLLPDKAYCLEDSLSWFFEIDRQAYQGRHFDGEIVEVTDKNGSNRKLALEDAASREAINEWLRVE